jgi:hypothetical protein
MQASPEEPGAKKRRTFFGKHAKCGQCHTCLHPALKRACMVNRPPEIAAAANISRNKSNMSTKALASGGPYAGGGGGGGGGGGVIGMASAAEFLAQRVDWPDDKPVPAHGVSGFKLPIDSQTRAKKWSRGWCVFACVCVLGGGGLATKLGAPDANCRVLRITPGWRRPPPAAQAPSGSCAGTLVRAESPVTSCLRRNRALNQSR